MTGLAHGGGAPEAAMIGLPLLLFVVFLALERRARRRGAAQAETPPAHDACEGRADDHRG